MADSGADTGRVHVLVCLSGTTVWNGSAVGSECAELPEDILSLSAITDALN